MQRLGVEGGGTPEQIQAFVGFLELIRSEIARPLAFVLIHHENKAGDVSGAWEGVTDTIVHVQARGNGRTAIVWRKARWASALHGANWNLDWRDGEGFALDERPETTDDDIREHLLALVRESPGKSWNKYDELCRGNATKKRTIRDQLIADKVLVNSSQTKGQFNLYLSEQMDEAA